MVDSQPTLNELAAKITELAAAFTNQLQANNIPQATFAADSVSSYEGITGEMFITRQTLNDALNDMYILSQGPMESVYNYVHNAIPDASCLNVLNHFDFWAAVPIDDSASYVEIAERTKLPLDVAYRVLQHAFTLCFFAETEPGRATSRVQHTSRSAALARKPGLKALVHSVLDTSSAPLLLLNEALERYSAGKPALTDKMEETAFALLHQGGQFGGRHANSWDFLENHGEGERRGWRQKYFVDFMTFMKDIFRVEGIVLNATDWKAAGKAKVVDVGGSAGNDAFNLARNFPDLTFVVEDMPKVKPIFEANLPAELADRVSYVEHDILQPQPVEADIYILKLIMHDYPDAVASQLLRNLVPKLRPGNRVLVIEYIGKVDEGATSDPKYEEEEKKVGPPLPRSVQQMGTATDLRMMALFNAKERPVEAYRSIVKNADERFEVIKVDADPLTFFATIEIVWRG
ncbi:O-methyltransferase [Colletotrichum graminicola M1.001]|uniref:O-methyltransferase n=1 Tax=Colletotrichum graminicola (strain M1.001 / M2 / FGSC 10212) TaxID=645133 RepID=E3R0K9_COLGM|nr:O-methyltransferase [Colletotrichum graminicola M1.001]EFQ36647.1 O-methyltransferase [Colletotrichum graminicola M1.001]